MNDMGYEFRTTISKEYLVIPKLDDNNYTLTITLDSGRYYLDDFFREMNEVLQANKSLLIESGKTILFWSTSMDMTMAIYTINIKTKNNE